MLKAFLFILLSAFMLNANSIIMNDNLYSLNSGVINFELFITQNMEINNLKGDVYSGNKIIANVSFFIDNSYKRTGNEVKIIGKFSNTEKFKDDYKDYTIKLNFDKIHKSSKIRVFNPINEDNNLYLDRMMNAFTYFGGQLFLNYTPPSKHYLSPNNYKIYYKSDLQNNFEFKLGTSISRKEQIEFKPNMKTFTIKVNWVDPITSFETTVFPEKTYDLKQATPTISTNFAFETVIGTDLILCRLANVKISSFTYRKIYADEIVLDAQIDSYKFNQYYSIVGKPIINFDGNSITVDVYLKGKPDFSKNLEGNISLKLIAKSLNKFNNTKSDFVRRTYSFNFNKALSNQFNEKIHQFMNENKISNTKDFTIESVENYNISKLIKNSSIPNNLSSKAIDVPIEISRIIEDGANRKKSKSEVQQELIIEGYDLPESEVFNIIYDNAKSFTKFEMILKDQIKSIFKEKILAECDKSMIAQQLIIMGFDIPEEKEFDEIYNSTLNEEFMGVLNNTYEFKVILKDKSKSYLLSYNILLDKFESINSFDNILEKTKDKEYKKLNE